MLLCTPLTTVIMTLYINGRVIVHYVTQATVQLLYTH